MLFALFYVVAILILVLHFTGFLARHNIEWLVLVLAAAVFPAVIYLRRSVFAKKKGAVSTAPFLSASCGKATARLSPHLPGDKALDRLGIGRHHLDTLRQAFDAFQLGRPARAHG